MIDGRRHSVDVPISRTLIALRRVKSLRDPSTNSMSKFSSLHENVNWETNSANEISLQFMSVNEVCSYDTNGIAQSKQLEVRDQRKERSDRLELETHLGKSMLKLIERKDLDGVEKVDASDRVRKTKEFDHSYQDKAHRSNQQDERGNFVSASPSNSCFECGDSINEYDMVSPQANSRDLSVSRTKMWYKNHCKSPGMVGDHLSRAGSPSLSASEVFSSRSTSLFVNEEPQFMGQNDRGCGISCCWMRTPRFRELAASSDVEGHPLLSQDMSKLALYGARNQKQIRHQTPRSMSQKFRPKSFNELVGQNVVARTLLGAISTGRITSLYLFHGPRGTGKTSASQIFAAALNCLSVEEHRPCGRCQECDLFFSGRNGDVKEVDSVKINRAGRIRSLIKNASDHSSSSRFKVFIIDECHLLHEETWVTLLNSLENVSRNVVYVLITPDIDKLPRSVVTRSQRFFFPKIKDTDVTSRLESICLEERLAFDQDALDFIACKANGSLRDAEMMLDQLSLLGRRITVSMAHELIGVVSDDELLDLLDLALSSDTSNTVVRARELMRSRIDPMQLVSQLANLIMDILAAGPCQDSSEKRIHFSRRHASESDMQRLNHALKVLSETEKQLRVAKNQTTWLTVALLQLCSPDPYNLDVSVRNSHDRDGDFCSTSSTRESQKHLLHCSCEHGKLHRFEKEGDRPESLESIWKRATELCQSDSFRSFLRMRGKLSSLCVVQDVAVAEIQFCHHYHVSKAEKSWKIIASSLQSVLGCNVEIRVNLVPGIPGSKHSKLRKMSFGLFNCSRRMQQKSFSSMECRSNSDTSDLISDKPMIRDRATPICSLRYGSQMPCHCCHGEKLLKALRSSEGNVLSTCTTTSVRSPQNVSSLTPDLGAHSSKEVGGNMEREGYSNHESKEQPHCFPRSLRLHKKSRSCNNSEALCLGNEHGNKLATCVHGVKSFETDSYVFSSNNGSPNPRPEDGPRDDTDALCWRTPTLPLSKAWELTHQRRRSPLVGWVLPCAAAK